MRRFWPIAVHRRCSSRGTAEVLKGEPAEYMRCFEGTLCQKARCDGAGKTSCYPWDWLKYAIYTTGETCVNPHMIGTYVLGAPAVAKRRSRSGASWIRPLCDDVKTWVLDITLVGVHPCWLISLAHIFGVVLCLCHANVDRTRWMS